MRLDLFLFNNNFFTSRNKASDAISSGYVVVNGKTITKNSFEVSKNDNIEVIKALDFVSKGGYKLDKARKDFSLNFTGKIYADIGASTGGYTDCLLKNGALKVYAVDVGENQLDKTLLTNEKVIVLDNTNARTLSKNNFNDAIDGVTVDCSFISLTYILKPLAELLENNGEIIALIKPQFETDKKINYKNGIINDRKVWKRVCEKIYDYVIDCNLAPINITTAPINKDKNVEFLIYLIKGAKPKLTKDKIFALIDNIK